MHPAQVGAVVSTALLGAGMDVWFDITQRGIASAFTTAGLTTTRWPGGKAADRYHWETNQYGVGSCQFTNHPNANSTFHKFMKDVVRRARLDVAITVNYGSNAQCTGGADPAEAVNWVAYANVTKHYNVTWWTVGNEQYTKDSLDLRSKPHDPTQYAQVVRQDYYGQMKAASPVPINVCVDVAPWIKGWDVTVLTQASFDCVELHYYPQGPTGDNDTFLVKNAAPGLTGFIHTVEGELTSAGRGGTPIYIGEVGSATGPGGKQTLSITQALYAGQVIGEMLNDGVARLTWHVGFDPCATPSAGGDFSPSLYGWQNYGGNMIFSDGQIQHRCHSANVPFGTLFPTANVFEMAAHFARAGEHMLGVSVVGMPDVRAYAATYSGGYALMLFNINESVTHIVPVSIDGKNSGAGGVIGTYDKAIYDASKNNVWKGPARSKLASWTNAFNVTLPPWSMVVVQTK